MLARETMPRLRGVVVLAASPWPQGRGPPPGLAAPGCCSAFTRVAASRKAATRAAVQGCRARGLGARASAETAESPARVGSAPTLTSDATQSLGDILRPHFPILRQEINGGMPLVYLDSGATSQKPQAVLDAMDEYYERINSNVHRGVHTLSALATEAYEGARDRVAGLLNAPQREEVVFTRNASEAINLVAYSWGTANLKPGDEVVLSVAEHHSNLVPWQMAAQRTGAVLKFAELTRVRSGEGVEGEEINVEQLLELITPHTRLVALQHVSNVLGSEIPVAAVVARAREVGALVLLDACQSVPHMPVDVQALDVDFLVASSHKMLGPTGIGFLWGREQLLRAMPPFLGGGEMILDVFLDHSTYAEPPARFEAGTPAIAEAVGLGAAIDFMNNTVPGGMAALHHYEMELASYLYSQMVAIPGVRVYGPPPPGSPGQGSPDGAGAVGAARTHRAAALCAFNVEGVHPTDLSTFLDQQHGIAIRSGHHCAQPLHRALGVSSSARASLHCYNTRGEVDFFIASLKDTIDFFGGGPGVIM